VSDTETSDLDRYPTLTEHGRRMLAFLRELPCAPRFHNQSGNRLTPADLAQVRAFEEEVRTSSFGWSAHQSPAWRDAFVQRCFEEVPFFREQGPPPSRFEELPTTSRAHLSRDIAQFVPDTVPVERLLQFTTSGTTGHPLLVASHPRVAASYLAFHKQALRRFGIELRHGRGQVGVVLVGMQRRCFTYVSVNPTMDESGLAKLNLHPDDWRHPDDRARYLDALSPEVITGDPLSFSELLLLPLTTRPRALLSTSMALHTGLRQRLEERFACPVLDLYSMNEAGPIAVFDAQLGGHVLLQHRLHVELLDVHGQPVTEGARGEVTLTGGFNFCLPLLRYRTGDHAALRFVGKEAVLVELQGRPPVRFRTATGSWLNNLEVTHALQGFALSQFALHQNADGALRLRCAGPAAAQESIVRALETIFGALPIRLDDHAAFEDKVVQYTSDLAEAQP
jgi:phenylacetate-CoA ligase